MPCRYCINSSILPKEYPEAQRPTPNFPIDRLPIFNRSSCFAVIASASEAISTSEHPPRHERPPIPSTVIASAAKQSQGTSTHFLMKDFNPLIGHCERSEAISNNKARNVNQSNQRNRLPRRCAPRNDSPGGAITCFQRAFLADCFRRGVLPTFSFPKAVIASAKQSQPVSNHLATKNSQSLHPSLRAQRSNPCHLGHRLHSLPTHPPGPKYQPPLNPLSPR